jgi:hypothetical protein
MSDWLSNWFGKRRSASPLARRLREYPPYGAPHVGRGTLLSEAQARANLAYFQQVLSQRLHIVSGLLREEAGIEVDAALAAPKQQAAALADDLHRWAGSAWPPLAQGRPTTLDSWLGSRRDGEDIVFSMLLDVTILLGELVRRGNADWRWDLDLDPDNLADEMPSARRVVLLADPVGEMPRPFVLDVEDIVVHRFLHPDDPSQRRLNPFRRLVEQGLRGEAMARWRSTATPPASR